MYKTTCVAVVGAIAFTLGSTVPARSAVIDLGHPSLTAFLSSAVGTNVDRSVVFDADTAFSITSTGIRFDPLANGATALTVSIYQSALDPLFSNGSANHGALLAAASTSITDVGLAFYDVPIVFSFAAGARYDLSFTANGLSGWDFGINNMEFYNYNFATPSGPYTAGPVSVVDGACHPAGCAKYNNTVMPHVRFETARVPEPATFALLGLGLTGLAASRRRKK